MRYLQYFKTRSTLEAFDLSYLKSTIFENLKVSIWDGKASLDMSLLQAEIEEYGIDALLLVSEVDLPDFIGNTNEEIEQLRAK